MSAPFKYDDDDWQVIADRLVLLRRGGTTIRDTPPAKNDGSTLESIVNDFVWLTARTDPRHPDVIATKNQLNKVAASIVALNAALAELDAMPAKPMRDIRFAMTGNCHPEGATFATWQTQTAKTSQFRKFLVTQII